MNSKLKTVFEVVAVCALLSLVAYGGICLYNNIVSQFQPVYLYTSKLITVGTASQLTNKLSQTLLTFANNQTIDYQDYPYVIDSLVLGNVYKIYQCNDGGYRVILDTHNT